MDQHIYYERYVCEGSMPYDKFTEIEGQYMNDTDIFSFP